jgi:purine-nucleoside phosphorylase
MSTYKQLQATATFLKQRIGASPEVAITLGSGLSFLGDRLKDATHIPYAEIPHFPVSSVPGHSGKAVAGEMGGRRVLLLCGRVHLYEGYTPQEICHATRSAILAGADKIILTNAAGCVWPHWAAGDIMLMRDHLNLQGTNVLCGPEDDRLGARFIDMTEPYDATVRGRVKVWARNEQMTIREGVYAGLLGPSYETPAEVKMIRGMGADAVGMSTVQETIAARQLGARVVGLSVLTNLAAGVSPTQLSHDEVKETAALVQEPFAQLIQKVVELF